MALNALARLAVAAPENAADLSTKCKSQMNADIVEECRKGLFEGDTCIGVVSGRFPIFVIPAKAGTQSVRRLTPHWVPAFAGMTKVRDETVAHLPPMSPLHLRT